MADKRKPLEAVRMVRADAVDARSRELARARAAAEAAAAHAEEVRTRATAVRTEVARQKAQEERLLHDPGASATPRELAMLAAFRVAADDRARRAQADAEEAARTAKAAETREGEERAHLSQARASLDVVEKHQAQARQRVEKEAQERTDEAAEDAFAARRPRLRG